VTAPVRDRKTVFVAVTLRGSASLGTKHDIVRGQLHPRSARSLLKPSGVGDVDALAVLGAGSVLDQQAVGQAGDLPEQAKYRDKTRQISGSPSSHAILPRCQPTNLRA
jgi:hypothetical protein